MFRKLGIFCAFLFIFFMFSLPVSAFEFIKSPDNPLPISFISDYSQILQVHVYKDNGLYKGIATAKKTGQNYYSLVAIESVDGKNWNQIHEILTNPDLDVSNARLFIDREGNKKILFVFQNLGFHKTVGSSMEKYFLSASMVATQPIGKM